MNIEVIGGEGNINLSELEILVNSFRPILGEKITIEKIKGAIKDYHGSR
jgi:hypothetical protein